MRSVWKRCSTRCFRSVPPAVDAPAGRAVSIRRGIEAPEFAARRGIERKEHEFRRRAVEHTVDHERVALDLRAVVRIGTARAIGPRRLETRDIGGRELREGRVVRGAGVAEVGGPVFVGGGVERRCGARRREQSGNGENETHGDA